MKKTKMKQSSKIALLTFVLLLSVSTAYAAGPVFKSIKVLYNDIKIVVDGKTAVLGVDGANQAIEPFTYNGTTYLPVRAVSNALGEQVDWDSKTKTVYVGERPGQVNYLSNVVGAYGLQNATQYKFGSKDTLKMAGRNYKAGYKISYYGHALFNLNSKYETLTFDFGTADYEKSHDHAKFHIYLDGKRYQTHDLYFDSMPKKLTIDVKNVNQIKFEHEYINGTTISVGIGNPIVK